MADERLVKALSLWQPWASLWLSPAKVHETRHWQTPHRGPLIVHASKHPIAPAMDPELERICVEQFGSQWRSLLPLGALIGRVDLVAMISSNEFSPIRANADYICGNWGPDRWGWERGEHYHVYSRPIAYVGRQQLFNVPSALDGR